jgi:hypothetical protein
MAIGAGEIRIGGVNVNEVVAIGVEFRHLCVATLSQDKVTCLAIVTLD